MAARTTTASSNQIIYAMPFSEVKDGVATMIVQLPATA